MQANELRIGNYIYDDFNEVHVVEKIESKKYNEWNGSDPSLVVFSKISDLYDGMYTCDIVCPIPVTREWLSKFGFDCDAFGRFTNKFERISIELYNDGGHSIKFEGNTLTYVKYVHQLQNLYFALTGNELTIQN